MSDWVLEIKAELNNSHNAQIQEERSRKKRSIYKLPPLILPPHFSDQEKEPYQPQAVSFGPYHHGEPRLKPMEVHKYRAFLKFLNRSSSVSLDTIFDSMVKVAQDLKDSYDSLEPKWENDTENFVKLMIVDGCFMLEILEAAKESTQDYSNDDPIFSDHGKLCAWPFIRRDMLLLENQLPMLVLFKLKGMEENDKQGMETLKKLILNFFDSDDHGSDMGKCLHILDLYHKSLLYDVPEATKSTKKKDNQALDDDTVRSATELKEAGIDFKRSESESLKDISFKNGVLRLPKFVVDEATESKFLNLIAFERCHVGADQGVTSFIYFMDDIVDHNGDISLLSSHRIILNFVGTDKVAADLFNKMSKDLMMDPSSHLGTVHDDIVLHCKRRCPKYRAMLFHTYFKSPWSIISLCAATILFAFATLSTVYKVMGK